MRRSDQRRTTAAAALGLIIGLMTTQAHSAAAIGPPWLTGRVTDFVTGEPIDSATIVLRGVGRATTNVNGRYRLGFEAVEAGQYSVKVRSQGYWRRDTWATLSRRGEGRTAPTRLNISLASRRGRLSMVFVNKLLRSKERGTARWHETPRFRIFEKKMECVGGGAGPGCAEWRATDKQISSLQRQWFTTAVLEHVPGLTGGRVQPRGIISVDLADGTIVSRDQLFRDGFFSLVEQVENTLLFVLPWLSGGETITTQVFLSNEVAIGSQWRATRSIALGLGYRSPAVGDCDRFLELGITTIQCESHGLTSPSEADVLHGRYLYSRPAGNRRPDRDPQPPAGATRVPCGPVVGGPAQADTAESSEGSARIECPSGKQARATTRRPGGATQHSD